MLNYQRVPSFFWGFNRWHDSEGVKGRPGLRSQDLWLAAGFSNWNVAIRVTHPERIQRGLEASNSFLTYLYQLLSSITAAHAHLLPNNRSLRGSLSALSPSPAWPAWLDDSGAILDRTGSWEVVFATITLHYATRRWGGEHSPRYVKGEYRNFSRVNQIYNSLEIETDDSSVDLGGPYFQKHPLMEWTTPSTGVKMSPC
jgi:hypothetical protein